MTACLALESSIKQAPGFVLHSAYPIDGGWRIVEIWESKEAATDYFAKFCIRICHPASSRAARFMSCTASSGRNARHDAI